MTALRALIVDDEPLSRRAMRQLLDAHGDVHVIAECGDAAAAKARLHGIDVIFLDVMMPRQSGLDLAKELVGTGPPFVVFVTAYDEYAVPAFDAEAVDYLPKPVEPDRLAKALVRVRQRLLGARALLASDQAPPEDAVTRLISRVGDREMLIPIAEIDCIEADGVYAAVRVGERRYLVRNSLDALERTLARAAFVRVHRSWIVPRDRIACIRQSPNGRHREIVLRTGVIVPMSRRRQPQVMRLLRRWAGA